MKRRVFSIELHPLQSPESGFWVSVPSLPGCFTQAKSYDEAIANAQEAIIGHIEALFKNGELVPEESYRPQRIEISVCVDKMPSDCLDWAPLAGKLKC